jgi:hypothetical protein
MKKPLAPLPEGNENAPAFVRSKPARPLGFVAFFCLYEPAKRRFLLFDAH